MASHRPRHPVGWLLLALGMSVTASGVVDGYARYGLVARPGALPAARCLAVVSPATTYLGFDLNALRGELLAVVEKSVQPTEVSLWLRPSPAATRR